jgi:hypothetical protein
MKLTIFFDPTSGAAKCLAWPFSLPDIIPVASGVVPRVEPSTPSTYARDRHFRNSSGSFAKSIAIRRAPSLVSSLAADRRPGSCSAIILFDQLVGAGEQRRRHSNAKRIGGFHIDG